MAEETPAPAAEEKKAAAPTDEKGKKRQKISRMKLAEVETHLKNVKEKMGAFQSAFARHLLARKKELTK